MTFDKNPLRYCLSEDTGEVVDYLLGEYLSTQIGKNDMAVANGFVVSAAMMIAAHCQRTGEDAKELIDLFQRSLEDAVNITMERRPAP